MDLWQASSVRAQNLRRLYGPGGHRRLRAMSMPGASFGYELKHEPKEGVGGYQAFALFSCRRCSETLRINLRQGIKVHNPEFLARKARDTGWQAHPYKPNRARCPACLASETTHRHEPVILAALPPTHTVITPAPEEENMAAKSGIVAALASSTDMIAPPKALANDARARIRQLLDAHFDDSKGCYLDGYSDQRIGIECGVAWKAVADLREFAYGALKEDPELTMVRTELASLDTKLAEKVSEFSTWRDTMQKQIDALRKRVETAGR